MQKRKSSRLQKTHQKSSDANGLALISKGTSAIPNGVANGTHSPDIMQKATHSASPVRFRLLIVAAAILLIAAGSSASWYPWLRNSPGRPASNPGVLSSHTSTLLGHSADSSGDSSAQQDLHPQQASAASAEAESHGRQVASLDQDQQCTGQDETCSEGHSKRCVVMVFSRHPAHTVRWRGGCRTNAELLLFAMPFLPLMQTAAHCWAVPVGLLTCSP